MPQAGELWEDLRLEINSDATNFFEERCYTGATEEVDGVPVYLDVLMVVNFLVDLLLLLGTNRLSGHPPGVKRALPAALLGGVYGGICVLPGFAFLSGTLWRVVFLALMGGICFGFRRSSMPRSILFILLSMALGGIALGLNKGGFWSLALSAAAVCGMCLIGFRGKIGTQYVPVCVGNCHFTALVDTGNTLTDPISGQQIMVVSPRIGQKLLRVGVELFSDPLKAMEHIPGLRLVPFQAVGRSGGVLPAKRFENVQIGSWRGSCLIAFSPNELGQGKGYEALTGGIL